ncbi:ankyrin repeat domain-containing protein [Candidatus Dependentiae bacterium]
MREVGIRSNRAYVWVSLLFFSGSCIHSMDNSKKGDTKNKLKKNKIIKSKAIKKSLFFGKKPRYSCCRLRGFETECEYGTGGPVFWFCAQGSLDEVKFFVDANKKKYLKERNKYGGSLLHEAAFWGKLDIVKYLVQEGFDIELKDINTVTPIYEAGFNGHFDVVRYLESIGAKFNANKRVGYSVSLLHIAVSLGQVKDVRYLLQKNAYVNTSDRWHKSPLHYVCYLQEKKAFEIAQILIESGACVNACNVRGNTPLHFAAAKGMLALVKYFIVKGAFLLGKNKKKMTAKCLALKREKCAMQKKVNKGCSSWIKLADKLQKKLFIVYQKILVFQDKYRIKDLTKEEIALIKIRKGLSQKSLEVLILGQLGFFKRLVREKGMPSFAKQMVINVILENKLHEKYPKLLPIKFIKQVIQNSPFNKCFFKNPEFLKLAFQKDALVDANGFRPCQKLAFYPFILPSILARYKDLYNKKGALKRIFINMLGKEETKSPLLQFLARTVLFARKKKIPHFLNYFTIFMALDKKLGKYNQVIKKIKIKKNEKRDENQKYSGALAEHILKYASSTN